MSRRTDAFTQAPMTTNRNFPLSRFRLSAVNPYIANGQVDGQKVADEFQRGAEIAKLSEVLAHNVTTRREALGLLLREVAESSGLSLRYVSNLEHGRGNPTLSTLAALAVALGCPPVDLLKVPQPHDAAHSYMVPYQYACPTCGHTTDEDCDGCSECEFVDEEGRLTHG